MLHSPTVLANDATEAAQERTARQVVVNTGMHTRRLPYSKLLPPSFTRSK